MSKTLCQFFCWLRESTRLLHQQMLLKQKNATKCIRFCEKAWCVMSKSYYFWNQHIQNKLETSTRFHSANNVSVKIHTFFNKTSFIFFMCMFCADVSSSDEARKAPSTLSLANGVSLQQNGSGGFQRKRLQAPTLAELDSSDSDVRTVIHIVFGRILFSYLQWCVISFRTRP